MLNDDWTPAHLTGGPMNLYKEMDVALKGEEWRQPGFVALAAKLATSAGEHRPITVRVPKSYEPKAFANPWPAACGAACTGLTRSQALPEPVGDAHASAARAEHSVTQGAAANLLAPPHIRSNAPAPGHAQTWTRESRCVSEGAAAALLAPPPDAAPPPRAEVELASMPQPTLAPAAAPEAATAANNPVTDFLSYPLKGIFSSPEVAQRLEA